MKAIELEKSLLVIGKFLRLFLNTLTADHKYSLLNRDNLRQPTQIELSQKQKTLSQFVAAFLRTRLNFENFQEKDAPHSCFISKITDFEKCG